MSSPPKLTALLAFMKGLCHASFSTIRKFLRVAVVIPRHPVNAYPREYNVAGFRVAGPYILEHVPEPATVVMLVLGCAGPMAWR